MSTIGQRRRDNLRRLIEDEYEGVVQRLAEQVGMPHSQVFRVLRESEGVNRRAIGEKLARRIEDACGKEAGWLDQSATDQVSAESAALLRRIEKLPQADRDAVLRMVQALMPDSEL